MIERVLSTALPPDAEITPDQFKDLMEMFITDLHLRKSLGQFWMDCLPMCTRGIGLAERVMAEGRMSRTPDLPEGVIATMVGAMALSFKEIRSLRGELMEKLTLLKQCPDEGTPLH